MAGSNTNVAASHGDGASHGSVKSYSIGFILSVILTAIPFGVVMSGSFPTSTSVPICVAAAVVQIVVHLVYFLHMNRESSRSWNFVAFAFTVVVVAILIAGSMWIMYHLDQNMMPGMQHMPD